MRKQGGTVIKPEMLGWNQSYPSNQGPISANRALGAPPPPPLPPILSDGDLQHFRRIHISEPVEPIRDMVEALSRLAADSTDAAANAFLGLHCLISWIKESDRGMGALIKARDHFEAAVESGIK